MHLFTHTNQVSGSQLHFLWIISCRHKNRSFNESIWSPVEVKDCAWRKPACYYAMSASPALTCDVFSFTAVVLVLSGSGKKNLSTCFLRFLRSDRNWWCNEKSCYQILSSSAQENPLYFPVWKGQRWDLALKSEYLCKETIDVCRNVLKLVIFSLVVVSVARKCGSENRKKK